MDLSGTDAHGRLNAGRRLISNVAWLRKLYRILAFIKTELSGCSIRLSHC